LNPTKEKKLTNVRAAMKDEKIVLVSYRSFTVEEALAYIRGNKLNFLDIYIYHL